MKFLLFFFYFVPHPKGYWDKSIQMHNCFFFFIIIIILQLLFYFFNDQM